MCLSVFSLREFLYLKKGILQVRGATYKLWITQKQPWYQFITNTHLLSDTPTCSPNFMMFLMWYSKMWTWFGRTSTCFSRSDVHSFSASSPYTLTALPGVLPCSPRKARVQPAVWPAAAREGMETQAKAVSILLTDCWADQEGGVGISLTREFFLLVLAPVITDKTEEVIWSCYLAQEKKNLNRNTHNPIWDEPRRI